MGDFREDGSPCSLRLCCSRPVGAKAAWLQHLGGCGVQIVRVRWWCAWCANRCSQGLFLNPSGVAPSQLAPARVANTRTRAPHWHRSLPRGRESKFTECFISQIRMPRSWNKVHIKGAFYFFFCSSAVGDESNGVAGNGDQSHDCSLVFQPLAVLCSRCRTSVEGRASMWGGFTQVPFPIG